MVRPLKSLLAAASMAAMMASTPLFAAANDLVEAAADNTELKTFTSALEAAGMTDLLSSDGPYTVFAPSNAAFAKLPDATRNALMKDKTKLKQVLSHHIIPGKFTVAEVKPGEAKTLDGGHVKLTSDNGMVKLEDARVTQSDILADNGVIHEIDTVVLPENMQLSGE